MIISLFSRNKPGVRGTINTDGDAPTATGVGETMLEAWLKAHEDQPQADVTRGLETFYASWGNQGAYSQVEPSGVTFALQLIEKDDVVSLVRLERGVMTVRDAGDWRDVITGDIVSGRSIDVTDDAIPVFDAGDIKTLADAAEFKDRG
jgi:hypothetical protein